MNTTLQDRSWLDVLLEEEGMTQAELARASDLDSGTISNIRNGKRRMGVDVAERIAKATHRKTQEILRMAGEIDDAPPDDPRFDRIETLYNSLEKDDNKSRALDFMVFLKGLEDKNEKNDTDSKGTKRK